MLRIHLSNLVQWQGRPLYEALVEKACSERLPGATVLSGIAGFVADGPLLDVKEHRFALQVERPVVLEMVGPVDALEDFVGNVQEMVAGHAILITLERAVVKEYVNTERIAPKT